VKTLYSWHAILNMQGNLNYLPSQPMILVHLTLTLISKERYTNDYSSCRTGAGSWNRNLSPVWNKTSPVIFLWQWNKSKTIELFKSGLGQHILYNNKTPTKNLLGGKQSSSRIRVRRWRSWKKKKSLLCLVYLTISMIRETVLKQWTGYNVQLHF
jgi:hypothetical protein